MRERLIAKAYRDFVDCLGFILWAKEHKYYALDSPMWPLLIANLRNYLDRFKNV